MSNRRQVNRAFCSPANASDCQGVVTPSDYVETSHLSSALMGSASYHHYKCPSCGELVTLDHVLVEGEPKASRPPLRDVKQEMRLMAEEIADLIYGKADISHTANLAVLDVLGLEADEQEMYTYKGETYTFDQMIQYVAPQALSSLELQERLFYLLAKHNLKMTRKVEPPSVLEYQLQATPWLDSELIYRCVNANGEAYYLNTEPMSIEAGRTWAITGFTLRVKTHQLLHKYATRGCAVSLQKLVSLDPYQVEKVDTGEIITLKTKKDI